MGETPAGRQTDTAQRRLDAETGKTANDIGEDTPTSAGETAGQDIGVLRTRTGNPFADEATARRVIARTRDPDANTYEPEGSGAVARSKDQSERLSSGSLVEDPNTLAEGQDADTTTENPDVITAKPDSATDQADMAPDALGADSETDNRPTPPREVEDNEVADFVRTVPEPSDAALDAAEADGTRYPRGGVGKWAQYVADVRSKARAAVKTLERAEKDAGIETIGKRETVADAELAEIRNQLEPENFSFLSKHGDIGPPTRESTEKS